MLWRIWLILLLLTALAHAEPLTITYTEPTASGTLARTTIYYCYGATCANWREATLPGGGSARQPSDNGNGGDAKSVIIDVPLTGGTLPQTVRVRVTATTTSGNENAGAIDTHTFTAP